jgi:hypothetical protein
MLGGGAPQLPIGRRLRFSDHHARILAEHRLASRRGRRLAPCGHPLAICADTLASVVLYRKLRPAASVGLSRVPVDPDYEARMAADIARLQSAKGVDLRGWLRANKSLLLVFLAYLGIIAVYAGIAASMGEPPGAGVLLGAFFGPLVLLRIYLRARRRRS